MLNAAEVTAHLDGLTRSSRTPGLQYLVTGPNGVIFEHGSGWANLRRQLPLESRTTLMAYSMSKTMTAAAALQLVESGGLELDAPIARYLQAQPYGPRVTVRQLISHTSGIPNPIPLRWVHPAASHASFDEAAALAKVLRDHPRLAFEPGTKYAYSNIGYWLLGAIIERASGEPFSSFVTRRILGPLGIGPEELGYVVADAGRHATGYLEKYSFMNVLKGVLIDRGLVGEYTGRWLEIRSHYLNGPAFGGLVGNAKGFGKFLQDQCRPQSVLFNETARTLFYAPQRTTRGAPVPMTLGWHLGDANGAQFFFKEGGGGGFHCMMRVYPSERIGSVAMCNATGFDIRRLLNAADPAFLGASRTDR